MKIVILTWEYLPHKVGGTEIATSKIAQQLSRRGHEITVLTTGGKDLPAVTSENGASIFRTKAFNFKALKYLWFGFKAIKLARKLEPDIIHAQAIWTGLPALVISTIIKKPYVVWGQGSDIYYPRYFKGFLSRAILKHADAVIALTDDMKNEILNTCEREIAVIGNGIDPERFEGLSKIRTRMQLKIGENAKVVIFVGSLVPVKGIQYLIEAINLVKRNITSIRLLIVGDGPERCKLEILVYKLNLNKHVTFYGRIDNQIVPEYLIASDVFALPSLSEGFPVAIVEAMATGLPVISTKVRGLPELVKEGINGFLVEPANPKDLADKVGYILTNKSIQLAIKNNNYAWANMNTWGKVVDKLEYIYEQVIHK